jgi:hypothetical protein
MKKAVGDVHIAGSLTIDDWKAFRAKLAPGADPKLWQDAFTDYFHTRLRLRYLEPIKVLQDNGTFLGEGFSIAAIQCSIVEFLESTVQGKTYRFVRKGDPGLGHYEYSSSSDMFMSLLTKRDPFKAEFTETIARDFYEGVRCGLLHEARTKNGWTIWAKSAANSVIDANRKIVYRDNFQAALLAFVDWYRGAIAGDRALQEAFIRKFDSLCI